MLIRRLLSWLAFAPGQIVDSILPFMLYNRRRLLLTAAERQAMREACHFNALLMDEVRALISPGVTTGQIDKLVETYTHDHGHVSAPRGYHGQQGAFPASCCTSVNDVICHGIPGEYVLKEGDIINVDLTTIVNGWHGDSSETFIKIGRAHV